MSEAGIRPEIGLRVDAGGIKTNYLDVGAGTPVVLVHGSGPGVTAYANWRLTLPALAPHVRALALDMVGFGFTDRPSDVVYGMETWTNHLLAFLDALELERVSVVGNSFGGALALRLAADHPDRVDRLVLMGSAGLSCPVTDGLDAVWGYEPSVANMRALLDLFAYDRGLVTDELAEVRYRASIEAGVQEAFAAMFPAPRQRWLDAMATREDRVAAIEAATLVVHGRHDRVVPLESSQRLAALIPDADLVVFARCGHWTQIERADDFNALLVRFLTGGGGRA